MFLRSLFLVLNVLLVPSSIIFMVCRRCRFLEFLCHSKTNELRWPRRRRIYLLGYRDRIDSLLDNVIYRKRGKFFNFLTTVWIWEPTLFNFGVSKIVLPTHIPNFSWIPPRAMKITNIFRSKPSFWRRAFGQEHRWLHRSFLCWFLQGLWPSTTSALVKQTLLHRSRRLFIGSALWLFRQSETICQNWKPLF